MTRVPQIAAVHVLETWDSRFVRWFNPQITKMIPADERGTFVRKLSAGRYTIARSLRRVQRSFLAILGEEELARHFVHGFDLVHAYRYVCSLTDVIRGFLAKGIFERAFILLNRLIGMLLEDSFLFGVVVPLTSDRRELVDAFTYDVRLFESAVIELRGVYTDILYASMC